MWWLLGLCAAYFLLKLFLKRREQTKNRNVGARGHGLVVQTSISTREYDPNAYRFDDIAHPEYRITYADEDGVVTTRDIYVHTWRQRSAVIYYDCWCYLRDERRTFRSDRILETMNLQTNRKIRDISQHRMR